MLHSIQNDTPEISDRSMRCYKRTTKLYQVRDATTTKHIELIHDYKTVHQRCLIKDGGRNLYRVVT